MRRPAPVKAAAARAIPRRRRPVGYRRPVKRTNASNCAGLALSKGTTRAAEQAARHQAEVDQINLTRADVWLRSEGKCETCRDIERGVPHEMNELLGRFKTRRRPAVDRFNTRICLRQCRVCHVAFHDKQLTVTPLGADGMNGDYDVVFAARPRATHQYRREVVFVPPTSALPAVTS